MIIYATDSEKVRESKRIANIKEQEQGYILGAMEPLTEEVKRQQRAGIERAREQPREWDCKIGTGGYPRGITKIIEGFVVYNWTDSTQRIRYQNGHNKYEYHMGFAGRARVAGQMNSGEDVGDEKLFGYIQRRSG